MLANVTGLNSWATGAMLVHHAMMIRVAEMMSKCYHGAPTAVAAFDDELPMRIMKEFVSDAQMLNGCMYAGTSGPCNPYQREINSSNLKCVTACYMYRADM